MKLKSFFFLIFALTVFGAGAQQAPANWQHLDQTKDGFPGLRTEKAYEGPLRGKTGKTVIVAVLDSGVDPNHEDLRDVMWTNPGEIPGNGIDDDGNGYIDDVHGWSFLGGKDGKNVGGDNLEVVRLYRAFHARFKNTDPAKVSSADKKDYDKYKEYEGVIAEKRAYAQKNIELYGSIVEAFEALAQTFDKDLFEVTQEDISKIKSNKPTITRATRVALSIMSDGQNFGEIKRDLDEYYKHVYAEYHYHYNVDFNPRSIIGDNYDDVNERYYGNNDIQGPDAQHGTHVAGIIGAVRNNNIGMDGVADNVRIMSVRTVPDGDEHDKDVANAILYAVENGASIINMSFGKGASPHKAAVDKAVRFAAKHDVLLVHAAGNDGKENTDDNNFPNRRFAKKGLFSPKYADNWIEVGAINWAGGENLAADFSNYSSKNVDVFAPGVDILSAVPDNGYRKFPGTSMAAPMVAGAAAVIRSHFPDLTAAQVKDIIMRSVAPQPGKTTLPGGEELVPFSKLSVSGGTLDLDAAIRLAQQTKGKKKAGSTIASAKAGATAGEKKPGVVRP